MIVSLSAVAVAGAMVVVFTAGSVIVHKREAAAASASLVKEEALTAEARLATERLKAAVAWRDVTPAQAAIIESVLRQKPMQITISWIAGDAEGAHFAKRLAETFIASGSTISAFAPFEFLGAQPPSGLDLSGSERPEVELLAKALNKASLGKISVSIDNPKPNGSKYFTHVQVGYRPVPVIQ